MTQKYYVADHLTGVLVAKDLFNTGVLAQVRPGIVADDAGTIICQKSSLSLTSGTAFVANDTVELGILPVNHVLVDFILATDSWDSNASPTLAGSIGLWPGVVGDTAKLYSTVGTEGLSAGVFGKTAVSDFVRLKSPLFGRVAPSATVDRVIGLVITTAAATEVAANRVMDFYLFTRNARYGK